MKEKRGREEGGKGLPGAMSAGGKERLEGLKGKVE